MGRRKGESELQVNVPSFFRCPISLDMMKSPVSLCTGVTYDRSSIERWILDGNNTCPATMQVLPTTDLVPNHTLHRLIEIWRQTTSVTTTSSSVKTEDLIGQLESSNDPIPFLRKLLDIAREKDGVERLLKFETCVSALVGVLIRDTVPEVIDLAVGVLALLVLPPNDKNNNNKKNGENIRLLASQNAISSLLNLIRNGGSNQESRTNAVRILERISSISTESKLLVAGTDGILSELARLVKEEQQPLIDVALSCLISLSFPRRVRSEIVRLRIVPTLGKILSQPSISVSTAEKVLKLLETASTCTEGRAAICDDAGVVITAILGKMMKMSAVATEHAVVVLWSVCHLFRDRRAQEAVAGNNGLTKILLLMQSNCSPAARQMAVDLLKIFKVNSKSCVASYDTKTIHIMPF